MKSWNWCAEISHHFFEHTYLCVVKTNKHSILLHHTLGEVSKWQAVVKPWKCLVVYNSFKTNACIKPILWILDLFYFFEKKRFLKTRFIHLGEIRLIHLYKKESIKIDRRVKNIKHAIDKILEIKYSKNTKRNELFYR